MDYINLGRTGLEVSRICLGTMGFGSSNWRDWVLDEEAARPLLQRAVELGINFFDTADMYSKGVGEEVLGRALRDFSSHREDYVIATKAYFSTGDGGPNRRGLSRKHLFSALDDSLRRLGTDYVDIFYIHRWNYATPIEETLRALEDLVRSGKVRYLGASSMFAWQFSKALFTSEIRGWDRFMVMQNHYNLVYREEEREMIPLCIDQGVGICPWSPLARGFLAGNRKVADGAATTRAKSDKFAANMYFRDEDFEVLSRLEELAEKKGKKPAQLALAWLLHRPGVDSPVVGATKMYQLEEAVDALSIEITEEEMEHLEAPYEPHPVLGHAGYGIDDYDR